MRVTILLMLFACLAMAGCFSPRVTCSDSGSCPDGELCDLSERVCRAASECEDCSLPFDLSTKEQSQAANPADEFGFSVSASGDTFIVGAYGDDGASGGSVYIYQKQGEAWAMESKQVSPNPTLLNEYGFSVAVSTDVAVVGAPLSDVVAVDEGRAYVYERVAGAWQPAITIEGGVGGDAMGCAVAVNGNVLAASACGDDLVLQDGGTVHIYEKIDDTWNQNTILTGTGVALGDRFASAVAIGDGVIVVGAPDDDINGDSAGAAYVFEKQPGGLWDQVAKLLASDGAAGDLFGHAVAADGDTIVIGAYRNDQLGNNAGAVYIFERSGNTWPETAKLVATDGQSVDLFGFSVAISGDELAVGSRWSDEAGEDSGSAYIFERRGSQWSQFGRLLAPDGQAGDGLGYGVALGQGALITTAYEELPNGTSGSVYVFERAGR